MTTGHGMYVLVWDIIKKNLKAELPVLHAHPFDARRRKFVLSDVIENQ